MRFIKPQNVRDYIRKRDRKLTLTPGFLALLDLHIEGILKRAASMKHSRPYLDAPIALTACRYPFMVADSRMNYHP